MTFEFHGVKYRVGFRHEKSRRWEDHLSHGVALSRDPRLLDAGAAEGTKVPAFLWCLLCHLKLSHLSRAERARNVHCTIWEYAGTTYGDGGKVLTVWAVVAHGQSHLNIQAGDQYDREKGRVAALRDALDKWLKIPNVAMGGDASGFRSALWAWFLHGRKRSAVERAAAKRV